MKKVSSLLPLFLAVIPIPSPCWSIHFHYLENNMTWEPTQEPLNCVPFWHNLHLHTLLRSLESITVGMIWLHLLYLKWNRRKWFIKCLFKYDYIPNIIVLLRPPSTPYQLYHIFSTFKFLFPEFIFCFYSENLSYLVISFQLYPYRDVTIIMIDLFLKYPWVLYVYLLKIPRYFMK